MKTFLQNNYIIFLISFLAYCALYVSLTHRIPTTYCQYFSFEIHKIFDMFFQNHLHNANEVPGDVNFIYTPYLKRRIRN